MIKIVFPAGIMQFPVFDVNLPEYVSYGAFGSVSGHELSHGKWTEYRQKPSRLANSASF